MSTAPLAHRWLGSDTAHLDQPCVTHCGDVIVGCYGGNTSAGAHKNEDAALVWCAAGWKFAALLDAHNTSQSAALVLNSIESQRAAITALLARPSAEAFPLLQESLVHCFSSPAFKESCRAIQGETACLICAQKEQFLWWLSVGDCLVFVLHPELAALGQYALNQRSFYEWIGRVNTFELPVPCYSSGVRELREGDNYILMVTDGLLECGSRPFEHTPYLHDVFTAQDQTGGSSLESNALTALQRVHKEQGRDSATLIYWRHHNEYSCVSAPS